MENFLEFIAGILDVDKNNISLNTKKSDLDVWDSLMMMRLIMEVEEEYGCTIPIENVSKIKSLNDIYVFTIYK